MGGLLILVSMVAFVAAAVSFFRPFPRLGLTTKARSAMAVVGSTVLFAIGGSLLPPVPPPAGAKPSPVLVAAPAAPAGIKAASEYITAVKVDGEELRITAHIETAWNDQQYVDITAMVVEAVGGAIQKGAPEAAAVDQVRFDFTVDTTDRLGKESVSPFMSMIFSAADLRAARFDNLSYDRVLNLSTIVAPSLIGRRAVLLWCGEDAHSDGAPFCSVALS